MKAALILFSLLGVACICSAQVTYLQSYNFQNQRIRHEYWRGKISELVRDFDFNDGAWKIVPGLADPKLISFESVNFPGHYLRHSNLEIWLNKSGLSTDPTFNNDATFKIVSSPIPNLDKNWVSFEAYTHPGYYIRHADFKLFIANSGKDMELFKKDVTFRMTQSWSNTISTFIQAFNHANHRIRHQDKRAKLQELSSELDRNDGSWILVPGLWDPRYVSFESVNNRGHYLRDTQNSELRLEVANLNSDDYKKAATFKIVPGLAEEDQLSFESIAKPGFYIHHWGFVFNVRKPNASTDATMEQYFGLCATFRKTRLVNEAATA